MPTDGSVTPSPAGLPNALPRPPGELEALRRIWHPPRGLKFITVINNTYVGVLYVGAYLTRPRAAPSQPPATAAEPVRAAGVPA